MPLRVYCELNRTRAIDCLFSINASLEWKPLQLEYNANVHRALEIPHLESVRDGVGTYTGSTPEIITDFSVGRC